MNLGFFRLKTNKLTQDDIIKFYSLKEKFNPRSDITCVISKNFKQLIKYIKERYDKTFTILANENLGSVIVVKEDFLEKYIIINNLDDLSNTTYQFRRYL